MLSVGPGIQHRFLLCHTTGGNRKMLCKWGEGGHSDVNSLMTRKDGDRELQMVLSVWPVDDTRSSGVQAWHLFVPQTAV